MLLSERKPRNNYIYIFKYEMYVQNCANNTTELSVRGEDTERKQVQDKVLQITNPPAMHTLSRHVINHLCIIISYTIILSNHEMLAI
jgi:hypothetical protein